MIDAALLAARQTFSPPFRAVLFKSLGVTLLLLVLGWFGLQTLAGRLLVLQNETANWIAHILSGLGLAFGMIFLITPITAAVAGLFLDDVAERVEREHYPADRPGAAVPLLKGLIYSARFFLIVLGLNLLMLPLIFVPVVNVVVWLGVNGYLLGREYFSLAAMRFHDESAATALRRSHRAAVFVAGLLTAGLALLPFANLVTPLFATAFFVHLHKRIERKDAGRIGGPGGDRLGPA